MAKSNIAAGSKHTRPLDWRRAISDHVAYALLVYTALQIFFTVHALTEGASGVLPYMALIVLVGGIIPVLRWFEARWSGLDDAEAANADYTAAFRRDTAVLWTLAIGLPLVLTVIFKALLGTV